LKPPKSLYKFRCWNSEKHRRILTEDQIWFTSARKFNDPFDCTIPLRYDLLSDEDFVQRAAKLATRYNPALDSAKTNQEARSLLATHPFRDPKRVEDAKRDLTDSIINSYGIFSLSAVLENILMWSHYADSHRGFCIEYDSQKLMDMFDRLFDKSELIIFLRPIKYMSEYPIPIPSPDLDDDKDDETWMQLLTTKSNYWSYEKEWRCLYVGQVNKGLVLDPGIITSVYLGCRMLPEHRNQIANLLSSRSPKVALYQAEKVENAFGLDFHRIN